MKRILWVEDDYSRLKGLTRPLEKMGIHIDHAVDYPSFLEKLKERNYDLFIIDLIVPQKKEGEIANENEYIEMIGLDILGKVEKLGKPIIVLTVVSNSEIIKKIEERRNVKKVLTKGGIFPSDFRNIVVKILEGLEN